MRNYILRISFGPILERKSFTKRYSTIRGAKGDSAKSANRFKLNNNWSTLNSRQSEKKKYITMLKKTFHLLLLFIILSQAASLAQTNDSIQPAVPGELSVNYTA